MILIPICIVIVALSFAAARHCVFGHAWESNGNRTRHCLRCRRKQVYQFGIGTGNYSAGTWVNTP